MVGLVEGLVETMVDVLCDGGEHDQVQGHSYIPHNRDKSALTSQALPLESSFKRPICSHVCS